MSDAELMNKGDCMPVARCLRKLAYLDYNSGSHVVKAEVNHEGRVGEVHTEGGRPSMLFGLKADDVLFLLCDLVS